METKPIEDLLAENEEALKTVDKAIEGLVHMGEQEDLQDVTEQAVRDLRHRYENRRTLHEEDLLEVTEQAVNDLRRRYANRRALHETLDDLAIRTLDAIEALLADGYPEEPMPEVNHDVTDDLDQNFDTMEYARSRFKVRPLTTEGALEAGEQHAPSE